MTAEEHLAEVKKLATARLKGAAIAAKHERLSLVDSERLAKLEMLLKAVRKTTKTLRMTREYKDVLAAYKDERYTGKRFLVGRNEFEDVLRVLAALDGKCDGPMGWAVAD